MSRRRIIVGQSEWAINESDVENVVAQVKNAMETGTTAELVLLDGANRPVTVFLNGKVAETVVIDLDRDPRPSEIS